MADPTTIKTGWKTTEFWVTLATEFASLLVATGAITPGTATSVDAAVQTAAAAVFGLVGAVYAISRSFHKSVVSQAAIDAGMHAYEPHDEAVARGVSGLYR